MPRSRRRAKRIASAPKPAATAGWRVRLSLLVGVLVVAGGLVWLASKQGRVDVRVPELSPEAARGAVAFDKNCARCHGANAGGSAQGPPLVHVYYHPDHHGDGAFHAAARNGVRQHHWHFGNMPAQPLVGDAEIGAIMRYVRELQQANGIGVPERRR